MATVEIGAVTPALMDALSRTDEALAGQLMPAFQEYLRDTYGFRGMTLEHYDAIYDKAYELGHGSGYSEVAHHYADMAEFASRILSCARPE